MILQRMRRALRPGFPGPRGAIGVLLWLAFLVATVLGMWGVISAHRERVRGVPRDFPAPVREADGPVLGVNVHLERYDEEGLPAVLSLVREGGFVWVRQAFPWSDVRADGQPGRFDWTSSDHLVETVSDETALRLVAVLTDEPPVPPQDAEQFASYAGAFASRYADDVDVYQIWDEPNLAAQWGGRPVNPAAYADLLVRTARAIRAADPDARIMLAGLAPTSEAGPQNLSDVRYLERLYEAGAAPYFDIVAAKPYGYDTGPDDRRVDESLLNASRVVLLREVMVANGDAEKAMWASHWGWHALPEGWDGAPSVWGQTDEATQGAHSAALLNRARDEWPWMGAMIIENLQPKPPPPGISQEDLQNARWGFSLLAPDGTPRPVYEAIRDWARSQPDAAPVGGHPAQNRWTTYEGGWQVGPLAADVRPSSGVSEGARAAFRFDGTRVALTVRRGPYRGFLYVTVDGEPADALPQDDRGWAYVVLYDERFSVATVPLALDLEPGSHTVEVVAEGGEGQWPVIDWRVGATPVRDGTAWVLAGLAGAASLFLALLLHDLRRVPWGSLARGFLALPSEGQIGLIGAAAGVLWAAASLTWGRYSLDVVASGLCLVLSVCILPFLTYLFALRLDVALAMVASAAPFYLVPATMYYRAVSMPELLVGLCCTAFVGRRLARSGGGSDGGRSAARDGERLLRGGLSAVDWSVALFVLAALLAAAAAEDRLAALFELRSVFLFPMLYYVLLRVTPLDRAARRRIVGALVAGGVGVALIGLGQAALGRNLAAAEGGLLRLQSVYHSPNSVGLYLGRIWPLLVTGAVLSRGGRRRGWAAAALLIVTLALVFSFSRGALLLALPASLLVMGWWAGGRYRWGALALVAVGALGMIPLLRVPRFAALLDLGQGTTFFRLKLWQSSLQMVREHPIFGVGPGNYLEAYRTRYVLPVAWEEFNLEHAHNLLLDHWTRLGLLGVAAGTAVQVTFWRTLARRGRLGLAVGLAGSMAALLAHGMVDNAVFFPDLALALSLTLALAQERTMSNEQ